MYPLDTIEKSQSVVLNSGLSPKFAKVWTRGLTASAHSSFMILPRVAPSYGIPNASKRV